MDNFLPQDYSIPSSSNYMKLRDGENRFRVLGSAVVGYEYWNTDNKPVRSSKPFSTQPVDIRLDDEGNPTRIKPFWAFTVWNYEEKRVQILEITQKSIMQQLKAYADNKKWGHPKGYDIMVTRSGVGLNTEYSTVAEPHTPVSPEIESIYLNTPIDLQALFTGNDPFKPTTSDSSPMPKL
jgi:hypothetical protein